MTRPFRTIQHQYSAGVTAITGTPTPPRLRKGGALPSLLSAIGLAALLACGGSGGGEGGGGNYPPPKTLADTLSYTNPSSGTYTLVKNTTKSTAGHLVLDLIGPAGSVSGVGFYLTADQTKVTWTTVDSGDPEKVKSATFATTIVKSKVTDNELQAGVYQKGTTAAVTATPSTVLASVALDLKTAIPVNTTVTLTAVAGKALILNAPTNPTPTAAITIATGTLVAN